MPLQGTVVNDVGALKKVVGNLTIAVKFCPRHSGKGQILHFREDLAIQILFYPGAENKQMSKVCPEAGGKGMLKL